jgi:2-aminoadipate transaminase
MNPSVIREILVTEKSGIISFAGGCHRQDLPVDAFAARAPRCWQTGRRSRTAIRHDFTPRCGNGCSLVLALGGGPAQVPDHHGSQQALDLIAKILIDAAPACCRSKPHLGAAGTPMEPEFVSIASDDERRDLTDLMSKTQVHDFFTCCHAKPTGRSMTGNTPRRSPVWLRPPAHLPLVGTTGTWFDTPPPRCP